MKKLKVMMMTLMMCLVSMSAWGQLDTTANNDTIIYSNYGTIYSNIPCKIFNLRGIDVTDLNGSLISGGYVLVIDDKTYKILVK